MTVKPSSSSTHRLVAACAAAASFAWSPDAPAQAGTVYTCTNAKGQHLRSDRPIAECTDREQRVLNRDGSLNRIVPPTLTADERAAREAEERRIAAERNARREAERADRLLMQRYPNEAAHAKAREAALDTARAALKQSEDRLKVLAAERKPLADEAEFYVGRALPAKLKHDLESNDAAREAQRVLIANQQAEMVRINSLYDAELDRLKKLWAGATPGSLGPLSAPSTPAARTVGASGAAGAQPTTSK